MRIVRIGDRWINLDQMTDAGLNSNGTELFLYFGGHADSNGDTEWLTVRLNKQGEVDQAVAIFSSFQAHLNVAGERYVFPSENEH